MKVLVTGGSGAIGSVLVDKLLEAGHEVINFDKDNPKYQCQAAYIKGNILDLSKLIEVTLNVDCIYHLAAEANVDIIKKNPIYSTEVNTLGTINVLEAARINKCKRVLYASTDWVYGSTTVPEVDENTPLYPPAPSHIYMATKIASEMLCRNYSELYGVRYTIMRFGIPYGPRSRKETVAPLFISKALNGEPITIHGEGEQFRQFIYVEDLVEGCIACLNEKAENEIFNLNGPEKVSVKRIAETIKKLIKEKEVKIVQLPAREGDFKGRLVDSSKAYRLLGWKPKHSYEEGMKKYIKWFMENEMFMKIINISDLMVYEDQTVREALQAICNGHIGMALVVDEGQKLKGIINDGDVRWGLVEGKSLEDKVVKFMNVDPIVLEEKDLADKEIIEKKVLALQRKTETNRFIPIVDKNKRIIKLVLCSDLIKALSNGEPLEVRQVLIA